MGKSGPTELTKAGADDDASVLSFFLNELLCLFDWIDACLRAPFHLGRRRPAFTGTAEEEEGHIGFVRCCLKSFSAREEGKP